MNLIIIALTDHQIVVGQCELLTGRDRSRALQNGHERSVRTVAALNDILRRVGDRRDRQHHRVSRRIRQTERRFRQRSQQFAGGNSCRNGEIFDDCRRTALLSDAVGSAGRSRRHADTVTGKRPPDDRLIFAARNFAVSRQHRVAHINECRVTNRQLQTAQNNRVGEPRASRNRRRQRTVALRIRRVFRRQHSRANDVADTVQRRIGGKRRRRGRAVIGQKTLPVIDRMIGIN